MCSKHFSVNLWAVALEGIQKAEHTHTHVYKVKGKRASLKDVEAWITAKENNEIKKQKLKKKQKKAEEKLSWHLNNPVNLVTLLLQLQVSSSHCPSAKKRSLPYRNTEILYIWIVSQYA